MSSVSGITSAIAPTLLSNADQSPAVTASLLQKGMKYDKFMINELLPTPQASSSGLDIRA